MSDDFQDCISDWVTRVHDSEFRAAIITKVKGKFRYEYEGSVISECRSRFEKIGGRFNFTQRKFHFPSGARILMLEVVDQRRMQDLQGYRLDAVFVDNGLHFSKDDLEFIASRIRPKKEMWSALCGGLDSLIDETAESKTSS